MQRLILALLFSAVLGSHSLVGQISQMGEPRKPNMETYRMDEIVDQGDVTYSGDLNLSIPVLTVPGANGHDFQIKLNYNSNITQRQTASWVGLGWSLDLGHVTRSVLGRLDEGPNSATTGITAGARALRAGWLSGSKTGDTVRDQDQPDQYNIQMEGLSDQLMAFPSNASTGIFHPSQWKPGWSITGNHTSGWLHTFTGRTDDGTVYTFQSAVKAHLNDGNINFEYNYKWPLKTIQYTDGSTTSIVYSIQALTPDGYGSTIIDRNYGASPTENLFGAGQPAWPFPSDNAVKYEHAFPDTLYTDTHYAVFLHSLPAIVDGSAPDRDKYERTEGRRRLNTIVLYDRVTHQEIRRVDFIYATQNNSAPIYDEPTSTTNPDWVSGQRLGNNQLTLVQVQVRNGSLTMPPYVFTYAKNPKFNWITLTNRGSWDQFFKGYYVNSDLGTAFRIKTLTLPSGGTVTYNYENLNAAGYYDGFVVRWDAEGNQPTTQQPWSFKAQPRCRLVSKTVTDQMGLNQSWTFTYGTAVYDPPARPVGMQYVQKNFRGPDGTYEENYYKSFGGCIIGHRWVQVTNPDGSWKKTFYTSSYKGADRDYREYQGDSFLQSGLPPYGTIINTSYSAKRGMVWKVMSATDSVIYKYNYVTKQTQASRIEYFYMNTAGIYDYRHNENSIWARLDTIITYREGLTQNTMFWYNADGFVYLQGEYPPGGKTRLTEFVYAYTQYPGMASIGMYSQLYSKQITDEAGFLSKTRTNWALFNGRWLPSQEYLGATSPILVLTYNGYDPAGRPYSTMDGNGNVTTYYYGTNAAPFTNTGLKSSQLTGVERIVNGQTLRVSYMYDAGARITQQKDENNATTDFQYDGLGRLTGLVGPNGQQIAAFSYGFFSWNGSTFVPNSITSTLYRSATETVVSRSYFDGVGYLRQEQTNFGPNDIVTAVTYDHMRRQERRYKTYEKLLSQPHSFDPSFHQNAVDYYSAVADTTPFDLQEYYADGTGRLRHSHAPGGTFQNEAADRYVRHSYGPNAQNEVKRYESANTLHKTTLINENGIKTRSFVNFFGYEVASIVDSAGLKLTTIKNVDGLGRTKGVWTPNTALLTDSPRSQSPTYYYPTTTGSITFSGLAPFPGRTVRVTLRNPGGGMAAVTKEQPQAMEDDGGVIIMAPQNGITVSWELRQYINGVLQPQDPNLQYWQYIGAWAEEAYPITYTLYPGTDQVELAITWITYWDPNAMSAVTVAFDYIPTSAPELTYSYDEYGRLSQKTSVDAGTTQYLYDKNNNLRLTKDARGRILYQKYDGLNRVLEVGEYTGPAGDFNQTNANSTTFPTTNKTVSRAFTYDVVTYSGQLNQKGRLARTESYRAGSLFLTTHYSYDVFGRIAWMRHVGMGSDKLITYEYDWQGNVTRKGFQDLGNSAYNLFTFYEYDAAGRLSRVLTNQDGGSSNKIKEAEYTYLAPGLVSQLTLGNSNIQTVDYSYNSRDWLTAINNVDNIGSDKFAEALHYFDGSLGSTAQYNGNIAAARFYNAGVSSSPRIGYRFGYDGANRLTGAQTYDNSWMTTNNYRVSSIGYDPNGNILNLTRLSQTGSGMDNLTYTYQGGTNKLNSVFNSVGSVTQTYTYDANGNALTDSYRGISGSTYDIHNLAISQTHTNGAISYWYDANGNRIRKQQGGTDHYYVTRAGGETEAVYNWNGSLRFWNITAGGQLIGKVTPGPLTRYYYLKDHLGSIRVTVKEDNTIAGWDDYYPFGMTMAGRSGNSGQADTKYKFIGVERDVETGYDATGPRFYDSRIARFTSVDPLSDTPLLLAWSPYHYSYGNPLKFRDPSGKMPDSGQDPEGKGSNGVFSFFGKMLSFLGLTSGKSGSSRREDETMTRNAPLDSPLNAEQQAGLDVVNEMRQTATSNIQTGSANAAEGAQMVQDAADITTNLALATGQVYGAAVSSSISSSAGIVKGISQVIHVKSGGEQYHKEDITRTGFEIVTGGAVRKFTKDPTTRVLIDDFLKIVTGLQGHDQ